MGTGVYPNIPEKHQWPAAHTPADFLGWAMSAGWEPGPLPVGVIFVFQPFMTAAVAADTARFVEAPSLAPSNARVFLSIDDGPRIGVSCLNPGGAAMVSQVENLRYLGETHSFISLGTAGSLDPELPIAQPVVISHALRDEGISHHYLPPEPTVSSDDVLSRLLTTAAAERLPATVDRATWTVAAPYRSTWQEIEQYRGAGFSTVEMEAASLFAVAQATGARAAAGVVISDVFTSDRSTIEWRETITPLLEMLEAAIVALRAAPGPS